MHWKCETHTSTIEVRIHSVIIAWLRDVPDSIAKIQDLLKKLRKELWHKTIQSSFSFSLLDCITAVRSILSLEILKCNLQSNWVAWQLSNYIGPCPRWMGFTMIASWANWSSSFSSILYLTFYSAYVNKKSKKEPSTFCLKEIICAFLNSHSLAMHVLSDQTAPSL